MRDLIEQCARDWFVSQLSLHADELAQPRGMDAKSLRKVFFFHLRKFKGLLDVVGGIRLCLVACPIEQLARIATSRSKCCRSCGTVCAR